MNYQRTASIPLPDGPDHGIDLDGIRTTDTQWEERHLQVLHLPDARGRINPAGEALDRHEVYELTIREPRQVVGRNGAPKPVSAVVERLGPCDRVGALERAVDLARERDLPLFGEFARLRPDAWTEPGDWVTCPNCESARITLVTNLNETDLTLLCRECDARVDESERGALFEEWLHCPSCASGDINVELSGPHGGVWWSCDDCLYDTSPAPIDRGYTDARGVD